MASLGAVRLAPARSSTRSSGDSFCILEDERKPEEQPLFGPARARSQTSSNTQSSDTLSCDSWSVLGELPIDHCQNQKAVQHPATADSWSDLKSASHAEKSSRSQCNSRLSQRRRPQLGSETFSPLDAVQEEASGLSDTCGGPPDTTTGQRLQHQLLQDTHLENHPLVAAEPNSPVRQQFLKHLTGQFEWLISYPVPAGSVEHRGSSDSDDSYRASKNVVFGCNLLTRKRSPSTEADVGCPFANTYTLVATPLEGDAGLLSESGQNSAVTDQMNMALALPTMAQGTPLKVPDMLNVVEQIVSPSLSATSERSSLFLENASPSASFSGPRIEDSLEELDRLEDQLEAVNAVTGHRRIPLPDEKKANNGPQTPQNSKRSAAAKRVSIAGQFATVRVKPSEKTRPSIRRSASLTLRDKNEEPLETVPEQKAHASLSRAKSTMLRSTEPSKPSVKSTKPPTIPKFELPGEAVSRRLKEQREARMAQRAEAEKPYVAPPRPKSNKPLTRPTFELPGEAISRRKREEREAKLKAQEEEERKRREFKARPMRQSIVPSTLPRETVTSRARQAKAPQDEPPIRRGGSMRATAGPSRPSISSSIASVTSQCRGRNSANASLGETSRATSASVGSASGKRSTLSTEEASQLRLRGREIFERENSYCHDKEAERRDREMSAKLAREEAAERSRAASREWAEKKRRKELALKEAMQAAAQDASSR